MKDKIALAKNFAKLKHRGQKRKDGKTPYWKHLQQVVSNLKKLGVKDQDVLCAGWLHDTIEDTATDFDDLEEKFGKNVAILVSQVTKDKRLPRRERELQYIKQLRATTFDAKTVKLGDLAANIADLQNSGYSFQKKVKQVEDKLAYLSAIKSGISSGKTKLSGLKTIENEINVNLVKYCKIRINLM